IGYTDPTTRLPNVTVPQSDGCANLESFAQSAGFGDPPATSTSSTATSIASFRPAQGATPRLAQGTAISTSYPAVVRTRFATAFAVHDRSQPPAAVPRSSVRSPFALTSRWYELGPIEAEGAPDVSIISSTASPFHSSPSRPPWFTTMLPSVTENAA